MNDRPMQFALREWRGHIRRPEALIALGAVACILAIAGPFETERVMRLAPRGVYWLFIVAACYSWGFLTDTYLKAAYPKVAGWLLASISALTTAFGVVTIVMLTNGLTLDYWPGSAEIAPFVATVVVISVIVSFAMAFIGQRVEEAEAAKAQIPAPPRILERLPLDKRAPLVALSVEDHYVRVETRKGTELILMRLSDAIAEVGDTPGAQVHRSHWAAFGAIAQVKRTGDRALLTMASGTEIPVSRANIAKLRDAGLLEKRA